MKKNPQGPQEQKEIFMSPSPRPDHTKEDSSIFKHKYSKLLKESLVSKYNMYRIKKESLRVLQNTLEEIEAIKTNLAQKIELLGEIHTETRIDTLVQQRITTLENSIAHQTTKTQPKQPKQPKQPEEE
ncbi:hypothetical protein NEOKW01_2007 [Nematocida sp. AWRm80]|nr:hypothetical protein NEOKW01_2007 [Nematocida sp. AWRm80]